MLDPPLLLAVLNFFHCSVVLAYIELVGSCHVQGEDMAKQPLEFK